MASPHTSRVVHHGADSGGSVSKAPAEAPQASLAQWTDVTQRCAALEATLAAWQPLVGAVQDLVQRLRTDSTLAHELLLKARQVQRGPRDGPLTDFLAALMGQQDPGNDAVI